MSCWSESKELLQGCQGLSNIVRVAWNYVQVILLQLKSRSFTPSQNYLLKLLYQSQMKEQPSKSGSFGADKPLVGQTDVQLDL